MKNAIIGNAGIRINEYLIGLSYADDKLLFARTTGELRNMLNKLNRGGQKMLRKLK